MKICFFSRCNLVYLYGAIDNALKSKYEFVHVAYSDKEYNILVNHFYISKDRIIHFKKNLCDYLKYDYSENDYCDLDKIIQKATDNRFNLNLSIQVDRALKYKSYEDSERLITAIYNFWNDYFDKIKPNIVVHEMVSLSINHLCAVAAKEKKILYISEIQIPGLHKTNLLFANYWGGSVLFTNECNITLKKETEKFIDDFNKKNQEVFFGGLFKNKSAIKYLLPAIKRFISIKMNKNKYPNLEDYIDNFIVNDKSCINKYKNLQLYSKIKWDSFDQSKNYYFYPFHLEPEAAVFFWGDGIYSNQIKLIENIAASLPPNTYLYVKDHPHDIGYRNPNDYFQLKKINNIKLINANESGYNIIKNSKGVITINGSAGFEALLLNKPVFYFGHPYYEHFYNTFKIENIKDLKNVLNKNIEIKSNFENFMELFSNTYEGNTAIFYSENYHDEQNLRTVIKSFDLYFSDIERIKC